MIRVFAVICKLKLLSRTGKEIFNEQMDTFKPHKTPCPHCGAKQAYWKCHATYKRYLITIENGTIITNIITITRVRCLSCKRTHALLPNVLIPHSSYSLPFVLEVLNHFFNKVQTISELCERYQISHATMYNWVKLFTIHKRLWLGALGDSGTCSSEFLDLVSNSLFSFTEDFTLSQFYANYACSFLQGFYKKAKLSSA